MKCEELYCNKNTCVYNGQKWLLCREHLELHFNKMGVPQEVKY